MEFGYRLTEEDYLSACEIKVESAQPKMPWWIREGYGLILLACVSLAVAFGLLAGSAEGSGQRIHFGATALGKSLLEAIIPAFFASFVYTKVVQFLHRRVAKRRTRAAQLSHFRSDPSCSEETRLSIDVNLVRFQCSADCFTQSTWDSYRQWVEKGNILLLVTKGGARRIAQVGGLSESERSELREILAAALPGK